MSQRKTSVPMWTKDKVLALLREEAKAGLDLSYSQAVKRNAALVRAAQRLFGSWEFALREIGVNYNDFRRYRRWTRENVVERIREWHAKGEDLSWRHVSNVLDPPLAAAALHGGRFATWADALQAAELDPESVARYHRWTLEKIQEELWQLVRAGVNIDQDTLQRQAPDLLAAVYRIGGGLEAQRREMEQRLLTRKKELLAQQRSFTVLKKTREFQIEQRTGDTGSEHAPVAVKNSGVWAPLRES
ncbi:MAG: hypothetical protein ACYDBB_24930 [Armatimonadota bacterium]